MKRSASRASLASAASLLSRRRAPPGLLAPPQPLALAGPARPAAIAYPTENGDPPLVPVSSPAAVSLPAPPPRLPLPTAPSVTALAVPASVRREVVPALVTSQALDDGSRWVGSQAAGKRKRAWQDMANDLVEAVAEATGRPYVEFPGEQEGPNKRRRLLLDTGNPTPSHVPVTEQVVFSDLPERRRLRGKRRASELEPTVQVMVAKKQRTDEPGSAPMVIETTAGPVQARVKRRRTRRAGPVDVEMIDVQVPLSSRPRRVRRSLGLGRRRRRRVSRRSSVTGRRRRRTGRRRVSPSYPTGVRFHPSLRQAAAWGAATAATRVRYPVVRYHPSIAASL